MRPAAPNESSPAEVAPLAQSVRLLRDQVDALQIAAAEKKTPWYRQMPSLAGLIALLLSVTTAVYSGVQGRKQDVQKKQESLRGIVSSLIELQGEQQAKLESTEAQKLPAQDREFIGGMINNRRMILAEAADNIVREFRTTSPLPNTTCSPTTSWGAATQPKPKSICATRWM